MNKVKNLNQISANGGFVIGVCEGRHDNPQVNVGYVFGREIAPELLTNPEELKYQASRSLYELKEKARQECLANGTLREGDFYPHINLVVSGLTVALIAILDSCWGCTVTLWHFDRESGEYFPQRYNNTHEHGYSWARM
jgi:hypothetical protein